MNDYQLDNLVTERNRLVNEARSIIDRAERERRDLDAAEQQTIDRIYGQVDTYKEQERSALATRAREREAATARAACEPIFGEAAYAQRGKAQAHDVMAFFRGETRTLDLDLSGAWREKRLIRAGADARELRTEYRDLQEDVTTAGGYAVPTSFHRQLVDYIEWYSGARQLNVTILNTRGGEALQIPNLATHGTAALRGEGTALPENDATFGQTTLNSWKYAQLVQVSNELLQDTGVDILGFIAKDTGRAIARATDIDYVTGSGSSKPKGLISTQAVGATAQTASTGVPSYENLVDLLYSVNPTARAEGAYWFTLDTNMAKIRKIVDANNIPLWQPSVQAGQPDTLLGYPVVMDPNVTTFATAAGTHMAFGNFSSFWIREAGPIRFERSDDFAFSSDLVTFRTVLRTDSDWVGGANGEAKFLKAPTS